MVKIRATVCSNPSFIPFYLVKIPLKIHYSAYGHVLIAGYVLEGCDFHLFKWY